MKATFYHAGCPVCVDAERQILRALDPEQYTVKVVHLGDSPKRVEEAIGLGVQSVPAIHLKFGAAIADLKL
jgi:glutaredoxin